MVDGLIISQINSKIMEDLSWRIVFGFKIEHRTRSIFDALLLAKHCSQDINAMPLKAAVAIINDVSRPIADKIINRAIDLGLIVCNKDYENETRQKFSFAPGVQQKLKELRELKQQIELVVQAQIAEPSNPEAGSELISSKIYYNIIDPKESEVMKNCISEKLDEFRGKRKGELKNAA